MDSLFNEEAWDIINKMAFLYQKIEDIRSFKYDLNQTRKFHFLFVLSLLVFHEAEEEALYKDGYSLSFMSAYLGLGNSKLESYANCYDRSKNYYEELDLTGHDYVFDYNIFSIIRELKNHREIYSSPINKQELIMGLEESDSYEYSSVNYKIHHGKTGCYPYFWESNLCDFVGLDYNFKLEFYSPRDKVKQKSL